MSTGLKQQIIPMIYNPTVVAGIDLPFGTSFPAEPPELVQQVPGGAYVASLYAFHIANSWKSRTALFKEVFPKHRGITREGTRSYVLICYGHKDEWIKKTTITELTWTWKALDADEISRPIPPEEITRRQADDFLAQVYQLDAAGEVQAATDNVFDYVDKLLSIGMFDVVNEILKRVRVQKLSTSLMRSLLTITFAAKRHIMEREDFFERVETEMISRRGTEVTKRLISRLA